MCLCLSCNTTQTIWPLDYMHSFYNKDTYLKIYVTVLQPVTNMKMWPISTNPTIAPPEYKIILGRPTKVRRKEVHETKKSEKLSRTGMAMTCSNFHTIGQNKRGCPKSKGVKSSTMKNSSSRARTTTPSSSRARGIPKKTPAEIEPTAKRGRERPKNAPVLKNRAPTATPTLAATPTPPEFTASSFAPPTAKRERGRCSTVLCKRPRVMEIGVFQAKNNFKALNQNLLNWNSKGD